MANTTGIPVLLEKHLIPGSDYIFGTADLRGLVDEKFGDHQYGISIGRQLDDGIIDAISGGPTREYFDLYTRINKELAELTGRISADLLASGIDAIAIEPTIPAGQDANGEYLRTLKADLSHKMVATRAGLGWIGKTDLFISKRFGPRLRLVSILVNKKPEIDSVPIEQSRCGKCNLCVEICPAGAANGKLWNISVHRDAFFSAQKCREMCGKMAKERLGLDKRICGICISVCPIRYRQ